MRLQNKLWITLFTLAFYSLFTFTWIYWVDPFPDRDGLAQIFYPHLNYLQLSKIIGNDFWSLSCVNSHMYPNGFLLLSALVSSFGFQNLFFENPWLIHIFLVLGLTLIAVLFPVPRDNRNYFILIVFFFPPTQLLLKGYNPHAYNIIFSLLGMTIFYKYLMSRRMLMLVLSGLAFWFSCTIKHMGIIHFLSFFVARLFVMISNDKIEWKEVTVFLLVLVLSAPFYDFSLLFSYIELTSFHQSDIAGLIQTAVVITLISLVALVLYLYLPTFKKHRFTLNYKHLLLHSLYICVVSLYYTSTFSWELFIAFSTCGIVGFFGGALILESKKISATFLLTITCSLTISSMFYFSHLGEATPIFFFSLYLVLFLVFLRKNSNVINVGVLSICVIWSNFFPESLVLSVEWSQISMRGMNIVHFNPWNWNRSYMTGMVDKVSEELEKYEFGMSEKLFIMPNLNVHTSALFQVSTNPTRNIGNISLLEIDHDLLEPFSGFFSAGDTQKLSLLSSSGTIAFILLDTKREAFFQKIALKPTAIDKRFSGSNGYGGFTKQMIFAELHRKNYIQRDYRLKNITVGNLSYKLWIHKKYKRRKIKKLNNYLEALRMKALMQVATTNPKALKMQRQSGEFLHIGRKIEASLLVHEAFILFSEHGEIELDWETIRGSLTEFERQIIEFYGFDLLKKVVMEVGFLPFEHKEFRDKYNVRLMDNLMDYNKTADRDELLKIKELSETNGLLAMSHLIKYMYQFREDANALNFYLKLYVEKQSYNRLILESNLALQNYLFYKGTNKEKALWYLKKSIHIFPKNEKALKFVMSEGLASLFLTLNLPQKYRKFYHE